MYTMHTQLVHMQRVVEVVTPCTERLRRAAEQVFRFQIYTLFRIWCYVVATVSPKPESRMGFWSRDFSSSFLHHCSAGRSSCIYAELEGSTTQDLLDCLV